MKHLATFLSRALLVSTLFIAGLNAQAQFGGVIVVPQLNDAYPNPFNDVLNITLSNPNIPEVNVSLSNTLGQLVFSQSYVYAPVIVVNTSNVPLGSYSLRVLDGNGGVIFSKKVLKTRLRP